MRRMKFFWNWMAELSLKGNRPPMTRKHKHNVAICVGHSRSGDNGAESVDGTVEWAFNRPIADDIVALLKKRSIPAVAINHYEGVGYTAAMKWLAGNLKERDITLALELHFNSADSSARGHEWLYWGTSTEGKRMAELLREQYHLRFPAAKERGIKHIGKDDRGALFLSLTKCPSVICEPFFGSNRDEWKTALASKGQLVEAITDAVEAYVA